MAVRQVLGVVGGVIGGVWFGNWQLGYAIGSAVGGIVDPLVIKGPRVGEIATQTSQEGSPRPMVWALSPPIPGNILATSGVTKKITKKSQGKGGPKVTTETLYRTYAIGVCEGKITNFVRVWRNGELIYDTKGVDDLNYDPKFVSIFESLQRRFGNNSVLLKKATFFLGSYDQEPSAALETVFGVGTTPAHRGTAYMVIENDDVTDGRGAIPQFMFQVERCEFTDENSDQVVLLLHADNRPGGKFQDFSTYAHVAVGEQTELSTTFSKFGGGSLYAPNAEASNGQSYDGSLPEFDFSTGDWTFEAWVYRPLGDFNNSCAIFSKTEVVFPAKNTIFLGLSNGKLAVYLRGIDGNNAAPIAAVEDSANFTDDAWVHVAACRNGNQLTLWKDGVQVGTTQSVVGNIGNTTGLLRVGATGNSGFTSFTRYIDEARITKGLARYTAPFAVPTAPFPDP